MDHSIASPADSPETSEETSVPPAPNRQVLAEMIRSRGLKFPKDPLLNTGRIRRLLRADGYEQKESEAVLKVVKPGDRVLELGAGIGYMSTLMSVYCDAGHITSYEANPNLIPYIQSVHAANRVTNVDIRHALLMPQGGGRMPFFVRKGMLGSSLTERENEADRVSQIVEVDCHDLSGVLSDLRPEVLVCDIEGAEADLLPAGDWSCLKAAVIEMHPQWIGEAGVRAVFEAMMKAGLTYFAKASQGKVVTFRKGWG